MKKFILGMATAIIAIPVAESLTGYICTLIEALKMNPTKTVIVGNAELQEMQMQSCEEECCEKKLDKIGFVKTEVEG